jgi:hypothetical protein
VALSFDEEQLRAVLAAVAKKDEPSWRRVEKLLAAAQLIALIVGGLWAWYHFTAFEQRHEELSQRQLELENEEKRIGLQYENEQKRLYLLKTNLENKEKEHTLEQISQRRLQVEHSMRLSTKTDAGSKASTRMANLFVEFTNVSQEPVEISMFVIEKYLGRIAPNAGPITFVNGPGEGGAVLWTPMTDDSGWKVDSLADTSFTIGGRTFPLRAGGVTGHLNPTEKTTIAYDYLIAQPDAVLVGFIVDVSVNGGKVPDDQRRMREWDYVPSAASGARTPAP